jgi:hypothetical protein
MVRFYWRADVQKKAKIMRKVKFPIELDVSELVSPRDVSTRIHEEKANLKAFPSPIRSYLSLRTHGSSRTNSANESDPSTSL